VHDPLQPPPCAGVGEDPIRQAPAVQFTLRVSGFGKCFQHRVERAGVGFEHGPRVGVRRARLGAERGEHAQHRALPRSDAAGQPDDGHLVTWFRKRKGPLPVSWKAAPE
jgi:hypothetical protein